MSDSEDYNSAKDEDFDEPADAESASDDEPLSKTKKTKDVGKKTKSPKKNGKSPKKAGRPPGKGRKSGPVKEAAKEGKRGRGRPPASATKTKKAEKPAKVSFSDDPLALSENEEDPLNNDDEDEVEDEYEVTTRLHSLQASKFQLCIFKVEAIVGHREYNGKLSYKIRWKNYDAKHDTWEDYSSLCCPDLLESYNFKVNNQFLYRNLQ